jgi:hypothetical protein
MSVAVACAIAVGIFVLCTRLETRLTEAAWNATSAAVFGVAM